MGITREELNDHTIYVATETRIFDKGTELRLAHDDGTNAPSFSTLDGEERHYHDIDYLDIYNRVNEYTLQQIADLIGKDVKSIRIKD